VLFELAFERGAPYALLFQLALERCDWILGDWIDRVGRYRLRVFCRREATADAEPRLESWRGWQVPVKRLDESRSGVKLRITSALLGIDLAVSIAH
jgi:hypothetical protein